jgi:hypothetical protein
MSPLLRRTALTAALVPLALYVGDNLVLRLRVWRNLSPFGAITVRRHLAIKQKNQRTEYVGLDPETRPCANSLLPQLGLKPCWWIARTPSEQIDF